MDRRVIGCDVWTGCSWLSNGFQGRTLVMKCWK